MLMIPVVDSHFAGRIDILIRPALVHACLLGQGFGHTTYGRTQDV